MSQTTLHLTSTKSAVQCTLANIAWITGTWHGKGADGWTEELWGPSQHNHITALFRHHTSTELDRIELVILSDLNGHIEAVARFFTGDLSSPGGDPPPAVFHAIEVTEDSFTLYTDDIDEGAWVKYKRTGNTLHSAMTIGKPCDDNFTFQFELQP